jgi:hypothetical protein
MLKSWILKVKGKRAFLLVEALMTVAILATALTLIVRSFLTCIWVGKLATDYIQAQILLENRLSLLEIAGTIDDGLNYEEPFPAPNEKFKFKLVTQNVKTDDQVSDLNRVIASVFWNAQKRSPHISVSTYLKNKKNE